MIKNLYIELKYKETIGELSRIREFKKTKKLYQEQMTDIETALEGLSEEELKIIELSYFQIEKLSRGEIADRLHMSTGHCNRIRKTALAKVKAKYPQ